MKIVTAFLIASFTLLLSINARAELLIEEGKQYARAPQDIAENPLVKELAKETANQIYVIEFFSYGCAGCHKLDPMVEQLRAKLPSDVSFQRIPVEFHAEWRNLTKAYYTAMNLNVMDKIHTPLFDAIHNGKITSSSDDTLRQFFTTNGVPQKDFDKEFDSFSMNRKQKWAGAITRAYRVTAVPAFVVQGPKGIFVTTARLAGSQENVIAVVEHLIKVEKGEIQASVAAPLPTTPETPVATPVVPAAPATPPQAAPVEPAKKP